MRNRVKSIKALSNGDCKYIPTKENPSHLGTRGVKAERLTRFWNEGPSWLGNEEDWPTQPIVVETKDTQVETLKIKVKVMVTIATMDDNRSHFITSMTSSKLLRITGWILQFRRNRMVSKSTGPLQTHEIEYAEKLWIRIIQKTTPSENHINKIMDNDGIWRINSRIHGYSSILLPTTGDFTKRLIEDYHQGILYSEVQATMCGIRERFWIPKLRSAVKSTIYNCNL